MSATEVNTDTLTLKTPGFSTTAPTCRRETRRCRSPFFGISGPPAENGLPMGVKGHSALCMFMKMMGRRSPLNDMGWDEMRRLDCEGDAPYKGWHHGKRKHLPFLKLTA